MEEVKDMKISITIDGKEQYTSAPFLVENNENGLELKTTLNDDKIIILKFEKDE